MKDDSVGVANSLIWTMVVLGLVQTAMCTYVMPDTNLVQASYRDLALMTISLVGMSTIYLGMVFAYTEGRPAPLLVGTIGLGLLLLLHAGGPRWLVNGVMLAAVLSVPGIIRYISRRRHHSDRSRESTRPVQPDLLDR